MSKSTVLVTGGAGFIGSQFIPYFLEHNEHITVVNLDKLTYAASSYAWTSGNPHPRYEFVRGDICDRTQLEDLFSTYLFDGVIHFAAESHVDRSITDPVPFFSTNVLGTLTLIQVARHHWQHRQGRFLHISTDEVYGSLGAQGTFNEQSPLAPNSPYSASKAASDLVVRSFQHTYGMNVVTTHCTNNFGPHQHQEKLIPAIIRDALAWKPIQIYGDGTNIRDWLYVIDHCRALNLVYKQGIAGETYNIGASEEHRNIDIALRICSILDEIHPRLSEGGKQLSYSSLIQFVQDRQGHDYRYAIDSSKIRSELGWAPEFTFDEALRATVEFYLNDEDHSSVAR